MRLLLDTHAFLWWLEDNPRLGRDARTRIGDPKSIVHVSAATVWELAIKMALGKLRVDRADLPDEITANGFVELPIGSRHAARAGALPRHHDDPFDRMLIAQAQVEELTLLTQDPAFGQYDVAVVSA